MDFDEPTPAEMLEGDQVREALRPADPNTAIGFGEVEVRLRIDPADLETEFLKAPETYARFVEEYTQAEGEHLRAKFLFEMTEARMLIQWREKLNRRAQLTQVRERKSEDVRWQLSGETKAKKQEIKLRLPTVTEIESAVRVSTEYGDARLTYIMAEVEAKRLKGFCDAARVKRDMLTNIGMRHNAELRITPLDMANARHPARSPQSPSALSEP